jgi:hypothetical protein
MNQSISVGWSMALGLPQESMAMKQEHLMGISPTKYRLGQLNMLRLGKPPCIGS